MRGSTLDDHPCQANFKFLGEIFAHLKLFIDHVVQCIHCIQCLNGIIRLRGFSISSKSRFWFIFTLEALAVHKKLLGI